MRLEDIRDVLYEIKDDVKEVRSTVTRQGQDIAQLKVWAWVSRSAMVGFLGAFVAWVKAKLDLR